MLHSAFAPPTCASVCVWVCLGVCVGGGVCEEVIIIILDIYFEVEGEFAEED